MALGQIEQSCVSPDRQSENVIGIFSWSVSMGAMSRFDYEMAPESQAEHERRSFWFTWPGAILVSIAIVLGFVFPFVMPEVAAGQNQELREIKEQLEARGHFRGVFEHVVSIEPVANHPKSRGRLVGEWIAGKVEPPSWRIESVGDLRSGYFTLIAQGYRKFSDQRPTTFQLVVSFTKKGNDALRITEITDGMALAAERAIHGGAKPAGAEVF